MNTHQITFMLYDNPNTYILPYETGLCDPEDALFEVTDKMGYTLWDVESYTVESLESV